jgi:Protein of unknown function (DUF5672)
METNKYNNITVVAIYGNGKGLDALPAIKKTCAALPGSKPLLITNEVLDVDIEQKLLGSPMTYEGYSDFVMYQLHAYIETEYALIVQHDGWALNAENWRDEWLQYDFIGGLTHAALTPDFHFHRNYEYVGKGECRIVQNGGFSLRSKRFLEAMTNYGITVQRFGLQMLNNEDIQLCCFLRPYLEKVGMRFAPDEEAKLFSFEHLSPIVHADVDFKKIFGHHSRFRRLTGGNTMDWLLTQEETDQIALEGDVYGLFEHYGYEIRRVERVG